MKNKIKVYDTSSPNIVLATCTNNLSGTIMLGFGVLVLTFTWV